MNSGFQENVEQDVLAECAKHMVYDLPSAAGYALYVNHAKADEVVVAAEALYQLAGLARSTGILPDAFESLDHDLVWLEMHAARLTAEHPLFELAFELYEKRKLVFPTVN